MNPVAAGGVVEDMAMHTKTLRLKVKREAYPWLNAAAVEVNQVWNWANATSAKAARPFAGAPKWLTAVDFNHLNAGASPYFPHLSCDTIQTTCRQYVAKRYQARRTRLRWRTSAGCRRSLGWVPFKDRSVKRKGNAVRFYGKTFRVFEAKQLLDATWKSGCFAQDAVGDWWLCLSITVADSASVAPRESVGLDLGLKAIATTSDGDVLEAGRWTDGIAVKLAAAQRRGHKRQAKRLHRKAANRRKDALHKFSRTLVNEYQKIVIGDVSSTSMRQTRMAKSVLDSGWGMLKTQLRYKGEHAGRSVSIVSEFNTSRACSSCGSLSGPSGVNKLHVRRWDCVDCGESHDRDVNAARNILRRAEMLASVSGNELSQKRRRMSIGNRSASKDTAIHATKTEQERGE